jgi:hypothetical protein
MGQLFFVIPFISKQLAKNWDFQCRLLKRTISSCLNQKSTSFRIVVIGHDFPDYWTHHEHVVWQEVDFPLVLSDRDPCDTQNERLEIMWTDRGRKLYRGIEYARQSGATHFLPVDSDDLVSSRLAGLVQDNPNEFGWFFWKGFRYHEGAKTLRYKPKDFFAECGTGTILNINNVHIPEQLEYDRGYDYYRFLINHCYIPSKMVDIKCPLKKLPYPGAVYVIHSSNFYAKRRRTGFIKATYDEIKNLAMSRPIFPLHIREFGSFKLVERT